MSRTRKYETEEQRREAIRERHRKYYQSHKEELALKRYEKRGALDADSVYLKKHRQILANLLRRQEQLAKQIEVRRKQLQAYASLRGEVYEEVR